MTKRDYIIIANVMAQARPKVAHYDLEEILAKLCIALAKDNPHFDISKFTLACYAKEE